MNTMRSLIGSLLVISLGACSGGDDDGGQSTASLITAAEGGTLALENSETRVVFPAGAVAEDTEMTLALGALSDFAAREHALADVLVFQPEMVLSSPAELQLDLPEIEADRVVYIEQFVDGAWVRPEVSAVEVGSGGVGAASVIRLAPTAIIAEPIADDAGSVSGTVRHIYTQEPLSGISFALYTQVEELIGKTTSDAQGQFSFEGVAAGSYFVLAEIDSANNCFNDPTFKELEVVEGEAAAVEFAFVPGPC